MTLTVAMYDKSYAHIGQRLDALRLDIVVRTFDKRGRFQIDGGDVPPGEIDIDYFWLSTHVQTDGFRDGAFDLILACRSVGVLQTFNAGLDYPFYKKASDRGIRICNSSAQGVAIAEYTLGQVLSVLQPIALQRELQARQEWLITPFREISTTHWLIIGFGPIGQEIARRVQAFGASVTVVRRTPSASPLADTVGTMADLPAFLPMADIIVVACPLNATTRGFADSSFFASVKPGAILVNIARGPLIDDAAMTAALDRGQLSTAILDVFHREPLPRDNPLWTHPQFRLTSHTSFAGNGSRARWDQLFLDNIQRFARGEAMANEVDPETILS
jgi:phosphoglycerate dehydrogenase-like enzyme